MKIYNLNLYNEDYNVVITTDKYQFNGALAVELEDINEGPFARLTVCLDDDRKLAANESFVDTNNCPWAPKFIKEQGLGEPTGDVGFSGFCVYPLYKFNLEKLGE